MAKTWKNPLRDALKVAKSRPQKNPSKDPPTIRLQTPNLSVRFQPPRQTSNLQTPVEVRMNTLLDNESLMLQIFGTGDANVTDDRYETVHDSAAPSTHTNHVVEGDATASIGRTSETSATLTRPSYRNLNLRVNNKKVNKQQKSKHRGLNKLGFATHYPEKLIFNTAGQVTFAQMRYEWELEHLGQVLDRSTFFKLAHTKKGKIGELPKTINDEAQQHFDMLDLLQQREYEAGKELTSNLKDQLFAEHFGPETQNGVRGYGIGVEWQDVPNVVIKKKGLSHQVQELRAALEIANNKHEEAILVVELSKVEVDKMKEATNLKEQKLEEDLNLIKRQMCAVSPLAGIFEGGGLESITSETLQSLITLLSDAAHKKVSGNNNSCFNMQGSADSMVTL